MVARGSRARWPARLVKRFAIFSLPDGRTVRYEENTVVNPDLMVLDIFIDRVYLKIKEEEYSIDLLNQITKVEG